MQKESNMLIEDWGKKPTSTLAAAALAAAAAVALALALARTLGRD